MDLSKKTILINWYGSPFSATVEPHTIVEENKGFYFQFEVNIGFVYVLRKTKSGWVQTTGKDTLDDSTVQYLGKVVQLHYPKLTDSDYFSLNKI